MVHFLAFSYFVIPEFRKELLKIIGYEYKKNQSMEGEILMILFSWNLDFYEKLKDNNEQSEDNILILKQSLNQDWRPKFLKRSQIFFYFLIEWITYIRKRLIVNKVRWVNIPGYTDMIQIFIQEI